MADALSPATTRAPECKVREDNFCQLHTSWLTSLGLPAVVRGLDVTGCSFHLNRTPREIFSPIAYFMASSGMDLRFTLNCRRIPGSWSVKCGSVATPWAPQAISWQSHTSLLTLSTVSPRTFSGDLTISRFSPRTQLVHGTQELNHACVQDLIGRQLPEGGWPFTSDTARAAVEPTALALLALPSNAVWERDAAIRFLLRMQNANGSWPAFSGDDGAGSGLTGLALYALNRCCVQGMVTNRAVHWLIESRGWESHWLWKWKFQTSDRHVRFDPDKYGWPWMPETISWVVPTAYSLLALKHARGISQRERVQHRIRRGVEMLYDRICPEGGWNAGNGVVYGFPLAPHADTTALALLSLWSEPPNNFITASLDWLERRAETLFAPWSLAWTIHALDAFGRPTELLTDRLFCITEHSPINDCTTLAIATLALGCGEGLNLFGADS